MLASVRDIYDCGYVVLMPWTGAFQSFGGLAAARRNQSDASLKFNLDCGTQMPRRDFCLRFRAKLRAQDSNFSDAVGSDPAWLSWLTASNGSHGGGPWFCNPHKLHKLRQPSESYVYCPPTALTAQSSCANLCVAPRLWIGCRWHRASRPHISVSGRGVDAW